MNDAADRVVQIALGGFRRFQAEFATITDRAADRFSTLDWHGLQSDGATRLSLYNSAVAETMATIADELGDRAADLTVWSAAKGRFGATLGGEPFAEIGKTFFSSVTRRLLGTEGTNPDVEFTDDPDPDLVAEPDLLRCDRGSSEEMLIEVCEIVSGGSWQNLERDARLAALEIDRRFSSHGVTQDVAAIEVYPHPFYRGRATYVVGRISAGEITLPLAVAIHHTSRGLIIGAVLTEPDDLAVLFSYTRSSFLVDVEDPVAIVGFLQRLIPHRKVSELYSSIGFNKHGKTERYRDLRASIASSDARFRYARGIRGMVMIVFTLDGYDAVLKVIRDRFPYPKQTTRRQVMSKYRMVFKHDRAGRLIDAHEFEHMRFDRDRFEPDLLPELVDAASRSVTLSADAVVLHHVYVERKFIPLDIYLRETRIRGELREVLERHHGDLFEVRFWRRIQDRVRSGEVIEIFPYTRSRRLGSSLRTQPASVIAGIAGSPPRWSSGAGREGRGAAVPTLGGGGQDEE